MTFFEKIEELKKALNNLCKYEICFDGISVKFLFEDTVLTFTPLKSEEKEFVKEIIKRHIKITNECFNNVRLDLILKLNEMCERFQKNALITPSMLKIFNKFGQEEYIIYSDDLEKNLHDILMILW